MIPPSPFLRQQTAPLSQPWPPVADPLPASSDHTRPPVSRDALPPAPSSSGRVALLAVGALLVLGSGGAAAYALLRRPPPDAGAQPAASTEPLRSSTPPPVQTGGDPQTPAATASTPTATTAATSTSTATATSAPPMPSSRGPRVGPKGKGKNDPWDKF